MRREFQILREELAAAVRRRVHEAEHIEVGEALALFARFVDHVEAASLRVIASRTHRLQ